MKNIFNMTAQLEMKYLTDTVDTPALAGAKLRVVQVGFVAVLPQRMSNLCCGQTTTNRFNFKVLALL